MNKQLPQFHPDDKVGFVYDNKLREGIFDTYDMGNSEVIVNYNGQKLRFTDCSIYKLHEKPIRRYQNRN